MRTCDQNLPRLFLFLGLIAALPAGAASPGDGEICGDRYFFEIEGPEGWQLERHESHDGLSLVYMPAGADGDASPIAMAITLPRNSARSPQVDLDQILNERVATLALFGDPRVIRDEGVTHASLASRSVTMELPAGVLHLSLIDTHSGEGDYFVASLVKEGTAATSSELAAFQKTINSLAFDPTRACEGAGANAKIVTRTNSFPASPDPAAKSFSATTDRSEAALQRAFSGCHAMQRMLVPVTCSQARVAGKPALVLTFEDGTEPAEVYLDRFRDRIAGTYCWARSKEPLPPLFFRSQGKARPASDLREYSCNLRDWGRRFESTAYSEAG